MRSQPGGLQRLAEQACQLVGPEGRIKVLWVLGHQPWRGPYLLHSQPLAPPGASVSAVRQPPNDQLDVFVVGTDGALQMLWEVDNGP